MSVTGWRVAPVLFALALAVLALAGCAPPQIAAVVALDDERGTRPPVTLVEEPTVFIAPFRGIPVDKAEDMDRFLRREVREVGIGIVRREDRPHDFRIVSYLTAVSDDSNSIVVFTFDVVDRTTGEVLHRVAGQQSSGRSRSDPWFGVRVDDLREIAEIAAVRIAAWFDAPPV